MSKPKHTPDWKLSSIDPEGLTVVSGAGVDRTLVTRFKRPEDAARAVACVNACEGIEDPADLRAQRDELLAACQQMNYYMSQMGWDVNANGDEVYSVIVLRAAIARAEGRKP